MLADLLADQALFILLLAKERAEAAILVQHSDGRFSAGWVQRQRDRLAAAEAALGRTQKCSLPAIGLAPLLVDLACVLVDLLEVQDAVFGRQAGDAPDLFSNYDEATRICGVMRRAVETVERLLKP